MERKKDQSLISRVLTSRLLIGAEIVVLILVSIALAKELVRRQQIEKEVSSLKKEIESLEKNRFELTELAQYFSSQTYKEEQAREKLGLAKPGEQVIIVPEAKKETLEAQEEGVNVTLGYKTTSNPQKWWDYFFSIK